MALLALGFLCGTCQATMQRDIVYKSVEGQDIALDVCTPDNSGDHPVAILVHGGGWGSGDKSGADKPNSGADISPWFDAFTEAGFTWFSINYRLAPASRWPACLEDTIDAIDWVQHHAADYGGDPQRIVIVGHSAGGQLAVLAALRLPDPTGLQGVIGCAAVTSFEQDLEIRGGVSKALQDLFDSPKNPMTSPSSCCTITRPSTTSLHKRPCPLSCSCMVMLTKRCHCSSRLISGINSCYALPFAT